MASDQSFYQSACGAMAVRLLGRRMAEIWPDLSGQSLLGLGYAVPYLKLWSRQAGREHGGRSIAALPEHVGLRRWPRNHPSLTVSVIDDVLPFPDLTFDRILLVHELESTDNSRRLLRELWRVLKDDGRLLVVVPNRTGGWTHSERTPFGQGRPFSSGQLGRVLSDACFRVERRENALFLPPTSARFLLRTAEMWERVGRRLVPQLAGVLLAEAVKDAYAPIPRQATRRLVVMEPV
jgi:SAM-dependent methyltransferase